MAVSMKKAGMPVQDAQIRKTNFNEVALGYSAETAVEEAKRCLNCKNRPCVAGCPVSVKIPEFIAHMKDGRFEEAYQTIRETNALPAVCGRVCPQESQCEGKCVRGIKGEPVGIGRLERFAADCHMSNAVSENGHSDPDGPKAAVVGAGPSGLTCAGELARKGYAVTVFEALHKPGGVLVYGIPEFRLPKKIVSAEIDNLKKMGVKIETDIVIGKTITVDELFEQGFKAVFIGSGAGFPTFLGIKGENLNGVYSANEYLTRINLMKAYQAEYETPIFKGKKVAVVGGGNVAMDAARSALRVGAETVYILYRRSLKEMPARSEEVEHASEEGVQFQLLTNPVRFIGDEKGWLKGVECIKMELGEPDASGRRRPIEQKGSEFVLDIDTAIIAVGTSPNPLIRKTTRGIEVNRHGCIIVSEESGETSRQGIFAGGDAVTGAATVILAMGAGRKAAAAMDRYIQNNSGVCGPSSSRA
ncbi:NADPH-dependent glutamate synthase [Clostridium sp. KNHs216]|uniref:NADPH-dependent glutamate synthase n=1 Tax=Clostridium sp. KNHs216 TaxID=1550235 RepID=UPI00114FC3C2|nr:NADPH-dependent glutamate synthase [Clostridium sp. KNHs216]TQI67831.1 glutamate synthase (NADPH/NADH) small chain [Clostridium sp. KNHs216]